MLEQAHLWASMDAERQCLWRLGILTRIDIERGFDMSSTHGSLVQQGW